MKPMKKTILTITIISTFLVLFILIADVPSLKATYEPTKVWDKTYGPIEGHSIMQTADGGYAIAGNKGAWEQARGPGSWVNQTFLLIKINASGDLQWKKTYGAGDENESRAFSLVQTGDGGYALAGSKRVFSGIIDGVHVITYSVWLVKTDGEGNMQWNRTLPWSWSSGPNVVVVQTGDGGYALAGSGNTTRLSFLIKTDKDGTVVWNVTFGGVDSDYIKALVETSDGGFAMAGDTASLGATSVDGWLVKTDSEGNLLWSKT
jgi:hypothetical protein